MMDYGFCDLCVNVTQDLQKVKEVLLELHNAGYNTVALNQNVDENVFDHDKKKKKKGDENDSSGFSVPEPIDISKIKDDFEGKLNILSRITFSFSDPVKTHSMNQLAVLKKYNLYAVVPKTQNAFQFACSQLNADIIYLNSGFKMSRKLYLQAVEREVHFEILYSDIIKSSIRRSAIHLSHLLYTFGKSKNVIISSGANSTSLIRNPYDVINLARLLGLDETKAKLSVLQQAHHLILKGEGRRCGKALFKINCNRSDSSEVNKNKKAKKMKI